MMGINPRNQILNGSEKKNGEKIFLFFWYTKKNFKTKATLWFRITQTNTFEMEKFIKDEGVLKEFITNQKTFQMSDIAKGEREST